ncbi:unnamed protein product, partial [Allacma fusca]
LAILPVIPGTLPLRGNPEALGVKTFYPKYVTRARGENRPILSRVGSTSSQKPDLTDTKLHVKNKNNQHSSFINVSSDGIYTNHIFTTESLPIEESSTVISVKREKTLNDVKTSSLDSITSVTVRPEQLPQTSSFFETKNPIISTSRQLGNPSEDVSTENTWSARFSSIPSEIPKQNEQVNHATTSKDSPNDILDGNSALNMSTVKYFETSKIPIVSVNGSGKYPAIFNIILWNRRVITEVPAINNDINNST